MTLNREEKEFLENYSTKDYPRPSLTADAVVFTEDNEKVQVLMIKRGGHPFKDCYALPGGFTNENESTADAVVRELKEEVGIDGVYLEQLYLFDKEKRDPRGWIVSEAYLALINKTGVNLVAGDDAIDARWFDVEYNYVSTHRTRTLKGFKTEMTYDLNLKSDSDIIGATVVITKNRVGHNVTYERTVLTSEGIAFDHAEVISYALDRIKNKIWYTDIAFPLLPEKFTVRQLVSIFNMFLGKEVYTSDVSRKMGMMMIATDDYVTATGGGRGRKNQLFKFNPYWDEEL